MKAVFWMEVVLPAPEWKCLGNRGFNNTKFPAVDQFHFCTKHYFLCKYCTLLHIYFVCMKEAHQHEIHV